MRPQNRPLAAYIPSDGIGRVRGAFMAPGFRS